MAGWLAWNHEPRNFSRPEPPASKRISLTLRSRLPLSSGHTHTGEGENDPKQRRQCDANEAAETRRAPLQPLTGPGGRAASGRRGAFVSMLARAHANHDLEGPLRQTRLSPLGSSAEPWVLIVTLYPSKGRACPQSVARGQTNYGDPSHFPYRRPDLPGTRAVFRHPFHLYLRSHVTARPARAHLRWPARSPLCDSCRPSP